MNKLYFWFSAKQNGIDPGWHCFCKIDSEIKEYSECSSKPIYNSMWDDVIFLGEGEFSHTEGFSPTMDAMDEMLDSEY